MLIKIASRKSDLARLQAYTVAEKILSLDSSVKIKHLFSASFGDLNPDISLNSMPAKGAFTEDFKEGIKNRDFDIVVHSWKDLPTEMSNESRIFTIQRADPRDIILIRKDSIIEIKNNKKINILTSSPRREHHIKPFIRDFIPFDIDHISCSEVRGNIPTRLKKLIRGDGDALIIAKAAIDRLLDAKQKEFSTLQKEIKEMLSLCNFMVLPLTTFPTAAAQGALALEVHRDNSKVINILNRFHCKQTYKHVCKERELLKSFGGGCHQKIGITSFSHKLGSFFSASGVSSIDNSIIKILEFNDNNIKTVKKFPIEKSFPNKDIEKSFFKRERINQSIPKEKDLFIAKDYALPESFDLNFDTKNIYWVSGLASWKKLAKKGHWVHGTSESLGEYFGTNIETIIGRKTNWLKLTHDKASISHHKNTIATYRLVINEIEHLKGDEENFYWTSASQFIAAIKKYPHISKKTHSCGAGASYSKIVEHIDKDHLKIYLGIDQWYKSTVK